MSEGEAPSRCRNCGREPSDGKLDPSGWCAACRKVVVRRATWIGRIVAVVGALAVAWWVVASPVASERFLVGRLLLIALVYFLLSTLVRRVAFELIRRRGVKPPEA